MVCYERDFMRFLGVVMGCEFGQQVDGRMCYLCMEELAASMHNRYSFLAWEDNHDF